MAKKKGKRGYLIWIILGLVCFALLLFDPGSLGRGTNTIGTVGSKDLRMGDYQRALNAQIRAFEAQTGARLTLSEAQSIGLDQVALSQLVAQRAVDNETTQIGLSIGDQFVLQELMRVPGFRGLDGDFDPEVYDSVLRQNGMTKGEFETSIREELSRTMLQGSVAGGLPPADIYASTVIEFIGAQRDFVWAEVAEANLTALPEAPTDAQVQSFYDANPELFTAPETRDITYVWLTPTMIQDQLTVDETALRQAYDDRIAEFVTPERRLVERLAFIDAEAAAAANARLTSGELDYDALVAERGLDLADVDLGDVDLADLGTSGEAVFALEPGQVAQVGDAVYRVNAVLAAQEVSFDDAAPTLREELAAARARRVIEDSSESINDLLAGGASLEMLAERSDLELGQINWSVESDTGIAAYDNFRAAASATSPEDFPELIDLADGGIFALRVNEIIPPTLRPLEDVRSAVESAYRTDAIRAAVIAEAERIAAEIAPLSDLASFGLTAMVETDQTRQSFIAGTPPGFMVEVFEMNPGQTRVIETADGAIIVRLDGTSPADRSDPQITAQLETIAQTAMSGIANDLYSVFAGDLQLRTDVQINQQAVAAVNSSLGR